MKSRWYDTNPTVSMAISLLQNTHPHYRDKLITILRQSLSVKYPWVFERAKHDQVNGLWSVIQKRKTMDDHSWETVELWRFLSEEDAKQMAIEAINLIYCLEHENEADFFLEMHTTDLETAI